MTPIKNRHYWLIQTLIGRRGDELSQGRYLVRKLANYREYPDDYIDADEEKEFQRIVTAVCSQLGIAKEEVEREAQEFEAAYQRVKSQEPGLEQKVRRDLERFREEGS